MFASKERWRSYFAEAVRIAKDKDYLSDLDWWEMGLKKSCANTNNESSIYEAFDDERRKMFKEIFGEDMYSDHFPYLPEED